MGIFFRIFFGGALSCRCTAAIMNRKSYVDENETRLERVGIGAGYFATGDDVDLCGTVQALGTGALRGPAGTGALWTGEDARSGDGLAGAPFGTADCGAALQGSDQGLGMPAIDWIAIGFRALHFAADGLGQAAALHLRRADLQAAVAGAPGLQRGVHPAGPFAPVVAAQILDIPPRRIYS